MAAPLAVLAFLSHWEILLLVLLLVLLFGVGKLPQLGKGIGEAIKNFRGEMKSMQEDNADASNETSGEKKP